ncbi:SH3 domain-containing C40 family peptidase [Campylobacter helveticus]|uniref:SH3 domain-containing C40 family peptidase n=1 Tax=Campylobacter helveticus TaxID=28898 RepID=UPI00214A482B|nr:SH3 domain-containing C40 family peptidase [Campylobacter helveticus]MCR2064247.1 SH3 domain-containing protein [Campylobacter helveticus]
MRFVLCFLGLFFIACSTHETPKKPLENPISKETNSFYAKLEYEQNLSILPTLNSKLNPNAKNYKKSFFTPWHSSFKNLKSADLFWSFGVYKSSNYYFFNKQKIPLSWFNANIKNANTKALNSLNQKALVVQNTILKNFPTQKAILKNPFLQSEGIPFDYTSDSVLNAGSAVLISHLSLDKRYAFVMSESGFGFVERKDLEIFSDKRAKIYENLNFITPLKEKAAVLDESGKFFFETRIGALYPYYKSDLKYYYGKIGAKKYKISKKIASTFPLKLNDMHFKSQIAELLSLPYGWGGYDFERDCSLFLRDIFAPFGIYLPRNSLAQNKTFKNYDISFLSSEKKKELLKKFAKPYATLLYMKGHIMLYAGELDDKSMALHSIWGLRLDNKDKRLLIGQSVFTSLEIGKNQIPKENLLLSKLSHLSFLELSEEEDLKLKNYLFKLNPELRQ